MEYSVFYEATPNPQSMKFMVTAVIADATLNIDSASHPDVARSPLARKIMGFPWAAGMFVGPNFVTVTKQDWVDWDVIAEPLAELIKEHLESGEAVVVPAVAGASDDSDDLPDDSPVVRQIKALLRNEIRPAVAMDGGDITFSKYEEGRVFLHMHGACAGCPSSTFTLKEGIETRMKELIPEVQEVVAV